MHVFPNLIHLWQILTTNMHCKSLFPIFLRSEFKSARFLKFKMADPIWQPELQKNDYFCNRSIIIALNQLCFETQKFVSAKMKVFTNVTFKVLFCQCYNLPFQNRCLKMNRHKHYSSNINVFKIQISKKKLLLWFFLKHQKIVNLLNRRLRSIILNLWFFFVI